MMPAEAGMPEAPAAPVKTICINVMADGTFTVNEEAPEAEEAGPMMGEAPAEPPEAAEPAAQPAASMDEALNLARQMLEGAKSEEMSVEQAFQGGFKGTQQPGAY